jgi:hypothetical protein
MALDMFVRLAAGPDDFGEAIAAALAEARDPAAASRRRQVALANSWRVRGAQLRELLAGLPGGAPQIGVAHQDGDLP